MKKAQSAIESPSATARSLHGQSAMEFLTTYGWAVLIALIVVGVLYMLGVFNPTRATPNLCSLPPGFSCYAYKITDGGVIYLDLSQSTGGDVTINAIGCSAQDPPPDPTFIPDQVIRNSRHKNLTDLSDYVNCTNSNGLPPSAGDYYAGTLTIEYTDASGMTHIITGDLGYHVE